MAVKYVSPYGSDSAAGTLLAPWLTITHALATVSSGDTINLRAGSYNELGAVLVFSVSGLTVQAYNGEPVKVYTRGFDVTASGVTLKDFAFLWDQATSFASLLRAPFGRVLANNCTLEHFIVDQQYDDAGGITVGDVSTNVTGFVANRVWLREFWSATETTFGFQLVNATNARITNYIADLIDGAAVQIEPRSSGTFIAYASFCNVRYFVNLRGDASRATHDNTIYNSGGDAYDSTYNLDWGSFGPGTGNVADVTFTDFETAVTGTGGFTATNTNTAWMQFVGVSGEPSDYHLLSASPGRGAATDRGVTEDFDGQPRSGTFDVGALQYTSADYHTPAPTPPALVGDHQRLGLYEANIFDQDDGFDPFSPQREVSGFVDHDYTLAPGEILVGALHVADGADMAVPDASVNTNRFYNPSHGSKGFDFADPVTALFGGTPGGFYAEGDYTQTDAASVAIVMYRVAADGTTTAAMRSDYVTIPPGAPRTWFEAPLDTWPIGGGAEVALGAGTYFLGLHALDTDGPAHIFGLGAPVQWATNGKPLDASGYTGSGGTGGTVSFDNTSLSAPFFYARYDATVTIGQKIHLETAPARVNPLNPTRQLLGFVDWQRFTTNVTLNMGMRFYDGAMTLLDDTQYINQTAIETFPPVGTVYATLVVRGTATAAGPAAIGMREPVFGPQDSVANLLAFSFSIGTNQRFYVDGDKAEMAWRGAPNASRSVGGLLVQGVTGTFDGDSPIESYTEMDETWDGTSTGLLTRPAVYFDALADPPPPPPPPGPGTCVVGTQRDLAIVDGDPSDPVFVDLDWVGRSGTIQDIEIAVYVEHTDVTNVTMTLLAPGAPDDVGAPFGVSPADQPGVSLLLSDGNGNGADMGTNDDPLKFVISDTATIIGWSDSGAPWAGESHLPISTDEDGFGLETFVGMPVAGTWRVRFQDFAGGDVGVVHYVRMCVTLLGDAPVPWTPPREEDMYYGRLPFHEAQRIFTLTGPEPGAIGANCGWYHTRYDPEWGSFGIVRSDGPLAGLVGERVLVTYSSQETSETRSVVVYIHDEGDMLEDVSISRRAFLALSSLAAGQINVFCQAMSEDRT